MSLPQDLSLEKKVSGGPVYMKDLFKMAFLCFPCYLVLGFENVQNSQGKYIDICS